MKDFEIEFDNVENQVVKVKSFGRVVKKAEPKRKIIEYSDKK